MNLRLLVTDKCYYKCPKCANKHYNLLKLPICKKEDYSRYESICLTGGEPLFNAGRLYRIIKDIRESSKAKIYLYTSYTLNITSLITAITRVDGTTFSLHHQRDVIPLIKANAVLQKNYPLIRQRSLRLKIFPEVSIARKITWMFIYTGWRVCITQWLDECPLPENEVFMRHEDAFK